MKIAEINNLQLSSIIFTQILGTSLLIIPGTVVQIAGVDGWISQIVSTLMALIVGTMVFYLYNNFPHDNLIIIFEKLFGKIIGNILGIGFVIYCILSLSTVIKQGCSITGYIFLPETSPLIFFIVFFLIVVYITKVGMNALARTNVLVMLLLIITFVVIIITAVPLLNVPLKPLLLEGLSPVLKGSLTPSSWMGQVILITMIFPYLTSGNKKNIKTTILITLIVVGIDHTIITMFTLGVLGLETKDLLIPVYSVAKLIEIDLIWRRLDVMIMFSWVAGVTLKMSFWYFCTVLALKQLLNLNKYEPIVFPLAFLTFVIAYYSTNNTVELTFYLGNIYPILSLFSYEFAIPLIMCLTLFIRRKRIRKDSKEFTP
ncbi:spore germination protein (amino acid permease) [Cytobacillus firmus]|uniref:Spore germination protein (Amino acid permease) n=2 Tax=Cytobacillus TaxID=2675230 RepID=A0A366JEU0_CYTFI|nr:MULTISPECIES: endospore germination permease [Cytobacillus]RBP85502.1 spore germination protein (amino acid permease) [Cytobacillus firmus]TDX34823.1 spore germination protein (amino acid permease) [Cytobacillus oceanisediminis]